MTRPDMTPKELAKALEELQKHVGPRAEAHAWINPGSDKPVYATLYPFGVCNSHKGCLRIPGDTLREAYDGLVAKWEEFRDEHKKQVVKDMALEIIRLTTEVGECTDAALRQKFDPNAVENWGNDACAMADEMATRGPFRIKRKRGQNAPREGLAAS